MEINRIRNSSVINNVNPNIHHLFENYNTSLPILKLAIYLINNLLFSIYSRPILWKLLTKTTLSGCADVIIIIIIIAAGGSIFIRIRNRDNGIGRSKIHCEYANKYYYYGRNNENASVIHPIVFYK